MIPRENKRRPGVHTDHWHMRSVAASLIPEKEDDGEGGKRPRKDGKGGDGGKEGSGES